MGASEITGIYDLSLERQRICEELLNGGCLDGAAVITLHQDRCDPHTALEGKMLGSLKRFFQQSLQKRPLITNVTVYASFYTAAEFTQQTFNKVYLPDKPDYKVAAGARVVTVGSTLYAPTLYVWYKFLDKKFVGTSIKTVMTKVVADQFLMTPTLLASFFIILSVLERRKDIFEELRQKYKTAFIANQTFWIPVQSVNFYLIPPHLRVVYVASASFVWINVLCYIKRQQIVGTGEKDTQAKQVD